jgi:hypothetical protein
VGQLKGLDCNNPVDFVEILETIDRDLGLGQAAGNPLPVTRTSCRIATSIPEETPEEGKQTLSVQGTKISACRIDVLATVWYHPGNIRIVQGLFPCGIFRVKQRTVHPLLILHPWQNRCTGIKVNDI